MDTPISTLMQIAAQARRMGIDPTQATAGDVQDAIDQLRRDDRFPADMGFDMIDPMTADFQAYYQEAF